MDALQRRLILKVREDIELRTPNGGDAAALFDTVDRNREHLRPWLPWVDGTNRVEDSAEVIARWEKLFDEGASVELGIFCKDQYIGNMGLFDISKAAKKAEIGYWLDAGRQGKGIMTDCVARLTDYAFGTLGLNRVYIHCAAGNQKSRAIPGRLGFTQEGILREEQCLYGMYHDLVVYGMLKREWVGRRSE